MSRFVEGLGLGPRRTLGPLVPIVGDDHCIGLTIVSVFFCAGFQSRLRDRSGSPILVCDGDSNYYVYSVGYVSSGP